MLASSTAEVRLRKLDTSRFCREYIEVGEGISLSTLDGSRCGGSQFVLSLHEVFEPGRSQAIEARQELQQIILSFIWCSIGIYNFLASIKSGSLLIFCGFIMCLQNFLVFLNFERRCYVFI